MNESALLNGIQYVARKLDSLWFGLSGRYWRQADGGVIRKLGGTVNLLFLLSVGTTPRPQGRVK
jgi:hypothetical protein